MDEYVLQASCSLSCSQGPIDWPCISDHLSLTGMWMQQHTGNDCYSCLLTWLIHSNGLMLLGNTASAHPVNRKILIWEFFPWNGFWWVTHPWDSLVGKTADCCPLLQSIHYNNCNYMFKCVQAKRSNGWSSKLIWFSTRGQWSLDLRVEAWLPGGAAAASHLLMYLRAVFICTRHTQNTLHDKVKRKTATTCCRC